MRRLLRLLQAEDGHKAGRITSLVTAINFWYFIDHKPRYHDHRCFALNSISSLVAPGKKYIYFFQYTYVGDSDTETHEPRRPIAECTWYDVQSITAVTHVRLQIKIIGYNYVFVGNVSLRKRVSMQKKVCNKKKMKRKQSLLS